MSAKFLLIQNQDGLRKAKSLVFGGAYFHTLNFGEEGALSDYLAKESVDVILADCRGSGGAGLDFVDHVRKGQPRAKIVLVSDALDLPSVIRSIRLGVKEVFQGVPDPRAVAKCLGELAGGSGAQAEPFRKADWSPLSDFFTGVDKVVGSPEISVKTPPPSGVRREGTRTPFGKDGVDEEFAKEKETLAAERVRLVEESRHLKDTVAKLQRQEEELKRREKELAERDQRLRGSEGAALEEMRRTQDNLVHQIETREKQIAELRAKISEGERHREESELELKRARESTSQSQHKRSETETHLRAELSRAQEEANEACAELANLKTALEKAVHAQSASAKNLEQRDLEIRELRAEVERRREDSATELKRIRESTTQTYQKRSEAEVQLRAEVARLEESAAHTASELLTLKTALEKAIRAQSASEKNLELRNLEVSELRADLDQRREEADREFKRLRETTTQTYQKRSEVEVQLRAELARVEEAASRAEAELSVQKAALEKALRAQSSSEKNLELRNLEVETLRSDLERRCEEAERELKRIRETTTQTHRKSSEVEIQLRAELVRAEEAATQSVTEVASLKTALAKAVQNQAASEKALERKNLEIKELRTDVERRSAEWELKRLQLEQREHQLEVERKARTETAASEEACASDRRLRLLRSELEALAAALTEREAALESQERMIEGLLAKADADLRQAASLEVQLKTRTLEAQERVQAAEKRAADIMSAAQARAVADERARAGLTEALMLERSAVRKAEERYVQACSQVGEQMQILADREAHMRRREFQLDERELAMKQVLQRVMSDTTALRRVDAVGETAVPKEPAFAPSEELSTARAALQACDEARGILEEGHRHFADKADRIASLGQRLSDASP